MKIALLDDWQNNALTFAEFERLKPEHQLDVFTDTVDGAVLVERLQPMTSFWRCVNALVYRLIYCLNCRTCKRSSLVACAMPQSI